MTMPGTAGPAFRERLHAAMRIPVVESLFPEAMDCGRAARASQSQSANDRDRHVGSDHRVVRARDAG